MSLDFKEDQNKNGIFTFSEEKHQVPIFFVSFVVALNPILIGDGRFRCIACHESKAVSHDISSVQQYTQNFLYSLLVFSLSTRARLSEENRQERKIFVYSIMMMNRETTSRRGAYKWFWYARIHCTRVYSTIYSWNLFTFTMIYPSINRVYIKISSSSSSFFFFLIRLHPSPRRKRSWQKVTRKLLDRWNRI